MAIHSQKGALDKRHNAFFWQSDSVDGSNFAGQP